MRSFLRTISGISAATTLVLFDYDEEVARQSISSRAPATLITMVDNDDTTSLCSSERVPSLSPSPSLATSSSNSSTFVATDALYLVDTDTPDTDRTENFTDIHDDIYEAGNMSLDKAGKLWVYHCCFCDTASCMGKAWRQVGGKMDLDVYDEGRPRPQD
jgi:hypothetical protein